MAIIEYIYSSHILLVSIAIGYIGYWHAYHGDNDAKEDKYLKILCFSVPTFIVLSFLYFYQVESIKKMYIEVKSNEEIVYVIKESSYLFYLLEISLITILFYSTRLFGKYWQKKGSDKYFNKLHNKGITNYKNKIPIINELVRNKTIDITQIFVYLQDGTILKCNDMFEYQNLSVGFISTDLEKNLAFYVDEIIYPDKTKKVFKESYNKDEGDDGWGSLLTIVPYGQIKYISTRVKKIN